MNKLLQTIEAIRAKLEGYRKLALKETPTRTIIIDPLLEALGWDVRDPNEVELEYPTVDGKSVDYALKINREPILLVEAKPLDDPLDDVKAITQVVGYAANAGIVWCILTNGVDWRVYRSVEKCPAPEKLMFEISLDLGEAEEISVPQVAQQMWRFSLEEMAKGTLDALGEQTFTDGKVRKALDGIMRDPARPLVNLVRSAMGEEDMAPQKIRESLMRVWAATGIGSATDAEPAVDVGPQDQAGPSGRSLVARKSWVTRRTRETGLAYDEEHHASGKSQEVLELYRALDRLCVSLDPGGIERLYLAKCISYRRKNRQFCSVHIRQGGLRIWLWLKLDRLEKPPDFARDVSQVGHWGGGDLELAVSTMGQFEQAAPLIRQSFVAQSHGLH